MKGYTQAGCYYGRTWCLCIRAVQGDSKHGWLCELRSLPSGLESTIGAMGHDRFTQPRGQHLGDQPSQVSFSKRYADLERECVIREGFWEEWHMG